MFRGKSVALLLLVVACDIAFCDELSSTRRRIGVASTLEYPRTRRGIVLVDDDFNVSPEPGVNQGWSDGGSDTTKMAEEVEGSGGRTSSFETEETSKYALKTTGDQVAKSTHATKTSPGKLEMATRTTHEPDLEGSGGADQKDISVGQPTVPYYYCLNSTCDGQEIAVFPRRAEVVPEGTNVSLTCRMVRTDNSTTTLRWYKYNASSEVLVQASGDRPLVLTFDIPESSAEHTGTYMCIRSSADSCCHRQLDVTVYQVPNYRYHLIIIGVVAAVSLFSCLLLAVCRTFKAKKYEVQLELQQMEADCIYKM